MSHPLWSIRAKCRIYIYEKGFFSSRFSGVPYFFSSGYYYYYLCRLYICSFSPISIIRRMLCTHTHTHTRTHTITQRGNISLRSPWNAGSLTQHDPISIISDWESFFLSISRFLFSANDKTTRRKKRKKEGKIDLNQTIITIITTVIVGFGRINPQYSQVPDIQYYLHIMYRSRPSILWNA
jgi:hypothetical protein